MSKQPTPWLARAKLAWRVAQNTSGSDLATRVAVLEMDLQDRDREIQRLRQEYGLQQQQSEQRTSEAASLGLEALVRKLAPLFSQLSTMQAIQAEGRPLRVEDVLKLFGKVEQPFKEQGLEIIGAAGEETAFDSRRHQQMSGQGLEEGDRVKIRFPGYQLNGTLLLKAMVSLVKTGPYSE